MNVKQFFFTQMLYAQAVHDMIRPAKQEPKVEGSTTPEGPTEDNQEGETPSSTETEHEEAPSTQPVRKSSKKTIISE